MKRWALVRLDPVEFDQIMANDELNTIYGYPVYYCLPPEGGMKVWPHPPRGIGIDTPYGADDQVHPEAYIP